jgi:hypothetical protein
MEYIISRIKGSFYKHFLHPAVIHFLYILFSSYIYLKLPGMQKMIIKLMCLLVLTCSFCDAQQLKPGFDASEYRELMLVSARTSANPTYFNQFPEPVKFRMIYQSPVMGLDNLWDFWSDNAGTAVISIRGTTQKMESWLANFYAAMVPAKGTLRFGGTDSFDYELAQNPRAAVHTGWLLSTAYLSKDILPKLDSVYRTGTRNVIITGHSQGGAISFLLTAYLYQLQRQQKLPADIRFKTYCSAAPKPGNLYFAYDYEAMTRDGWAFNVVNSADWVPETPFSIQTIRDFNNTNPFKNARKMLKKQKFPKNLVLTHVYNRMDKVTDKARRKYEKYLGRYVYKMTGKYVTGFKAPEYFNSMNYVRTGVTVILHASDEYYKQFADSDTNVFIHHLHKPYLYLLNQDYLKKTGNF